MSEGAPLDNLAPRSGRATRTSGLAIASLVVGIAGLFVAPVLGSVIALVLGYSARRELQRDPRLEGHGYATAGIVLGWVGLVLSIVVLLVFLAVFNAAS